MVELTQDLVKSLFNYKNGELYWKIHRPGIKVGSIAGYIHKSGYKRIGINGKVHYSHRLIYLYHYGYIPNEIDHINRSQSDNRIENLRDVTTSQNQMNCKPNINSSSIYKGVSLYKASNKWVANIKINGKRKYLGLFINEIDAAKVYNKAAIKLFGEYTNLNSILRGK